MPLSRGRKNKKKKVAPKRAKKNHEEFVIPGGKIIRDGKNLFSKTNRTEKEQEDLLTAIRESRPEMLKKLQEYIDRAIEIFSSYDRIKLLGMIAFNMMLKHDDPDDDGACELAMEYGQSFATAVREISSDEPTGEIGNEVIGLLYNIRKLYSQYVMTESAEKNIPELENKMRYKTITESLYMRGNGYPQHIYQVYKELFEGHNPFLLEKYGFSSQDILETFLQLEDSFAARASFPGDKFPPRAAFNRFRDWQISKGYTDFSTDDLGPLKQFLADNPDIPARDNRPCSFLINDIAEIEPLYRIRYRKPVHQKVAEALSIKFGDNTEFLNPAFKGLPLNDSLSNMKPIISDNGENYLFAFNLLTRNLFTITEKLLLDGDKQYYNKKFLGNSSAFSRDNYLEAAATRLFQAFIPNSQANPNLKYRPGQKDESGHLIETEIDLLLESEKAVYLVEMKAGGLAVPSRRGALKSLKKQLADSIGYGAYQSYRAYRYLKEDPNAVFYNKEGITVPIDVSKKIFRITITLEQLTGFLSSLDDLQILGIVENNVQFAWTLSLFDLMIFSEILENEYDFIDYLEQRIELYSNTAVHVDDEIDFLGQFLDTGKLVDHKLLKKADSYRLNKTSGDIDRYFLKGGEKPRKKRK
ncbi:hypothetical protein [Flavobacterium undicola]|uniref:hypothetical protein n=1 Tax=Flavobacterium undicola TaxID=1932779 RepID=UPI001376EDD2|nr:hypothetical protein [Flavobacterium undicola]MBA0882458.1 hypothetical protein [Flavobacterium undicola]